MPRVEVIGWPRSGTTWLSSCLAECIGYAWGSYEKKSNPQTDNLVFHSHWLPRQGLGKVVLVVRDIRSVLVSQYFMVKRYDSKWQGDIADFMQVIKEGGKYGLPLGGWVNFYESWLDHPHFLAKHEQAIQFRAFALTQIISWLGLPIHNQTIAKTCAKWETMTRKAYEGQGVIKAGAEVWRKYVNNELEQYILSYAGQTMKRLGYG